MRNILLIVSLLCAAFGATAQRDDWERIKADKKNYLYGEGYGVTVAEADKVALNDLISKISVSITGKTDQLETEVAGSNGVDSQSEFSMSVSTYSQATLSNTEKIIIKNEPDAHVGRWIKRSEINRIFESRKDKIRDYVGAALKAESVGKIDVALKDYYWAFTMLKSLQYPNEVKYMTDDGDELLLMSWIPREMNEIFDNIKTVVTNRDGDDVELMITYKDRPVSSIDYTYFDGRDWSNIYRAKDGVGVLELAPGNMSENFQLKFEYEYRGESHIDREVSDVLQAVSSMPMPGAYCYVKSRKSKKEPKLELNEHGTSTFSQVSKVNFVRPTESNADALSKDAIEKVISSIAMRKYITGEDSTRIFTDYGWDVYKRLIRYGRARLVGKPDVRFFNSNGSLTARGVQMSFSFKSGACKSFVEDLVFSFTDEGKIDNISFGLGKTAEEDILGKGVWDEKARFAIMDFLENYQTAYALKRLDYIETIFDDDAVIITGTVAHVAPKVNSDGTGGRMSHDIIKYNRHTKDSYLDQLRRSFDSKEFINLRFADNEVRKLGKGGELYAIQISQEYYSSNYGDKGYLFLMVDINEPSKPIIKVRTWQPEKDPEFGLYGPELFK